MKKEDKDLLFKDLSARLPYHVKVKVWLKDGTIEEGVLDLEHNYADVLLDTFYYNKIKDIKPYLRPISSMTNEEYKIYHELITGMFETGVLNNFEILLDFFNSHHFDFRGLIKKGLAIAVTEENNPYKIAK